MLDENIIKININVVYEHRKTEIFSGESSRCTSVPIFVDGS
jgi:hypothetical protein